MSETGDTRAAFIETFGRFTAAEGLTPIAGRIFGLLYYDGATLALADLAAELAISKASASTNARQLAELGLIEQVRVDGDRRDFYRASEAPFLNMINGMQDRMTAMIAFVAHVRTAQHDAARIERLSEFIDFHTRLTQVIRMFAEHESPNSDRNRP